MPTNKWTKEKPSFKKDCILITATYFQNTGWEYTLYEIKKSEGFNEEGMGAYYWGIFCEDGEEWGDIADLSANLYLKLAAL
jgi:hypothetical protein